MGYWNGAGGKGGISSRGNCSLSSVLEASTESRDNSEERENC